MSQTPREIVWKTLRFEFPERIARHLWVLPWANDHHPGVIETLEQRFPPDIIRAPGVAQASTRAQGDPYAVGTCVDEWGCIFTNRQAGVIGEVKQPLIESVGDWEKVEPPYELRPADPDSARTRVNAFCAETDRFVLAPVCPRPWERMQFILGTEQAMLALMMYPEESRALLRHIHEYYLDELQFWLTTDVDALMFMDDWGSQKALLIDPGLWREVFRPLYEDYVRLAHDRGKAIFMHSDGFIEAIYPDLVEIGVDALNSQLFIMDMERLAEAARGRMTFWGEIDRQHVLAQPDPEVAREAVNKVARHLYDPRGGVIAQFEFGPGTQPDSALAVFEQWEKIPSSGIALTKD